MLQTTARRTVTYMDMLQRHVSRLGTTGTLVTLLMPEHSFCRCWPLYGTGLRAWRDSINRSTLYEPAGQCPVIAEDMYWSIVNLASIHDCHSCLLAQWGMPKEARWRSYPSVDVEDGFLSSPLPLHKSSTEGNIFWTFLDLQGNWTCSTSMQRPTHSTMDLERQCKTEVRAWITCQQLRYIKVNQEPSSCASRLCMVCAPWPCLCSFRGVHSLAHARSNLQFLQRRTLWCCNTYFSILFNSFAPY